jgi:acylglycerol lipase
VLIRAIGFASCGAGLCVGFALLWLGSCAPPRDYSDRPNTNGGAAPLATIDPRFTAGDFITTDGERLPLHRWLPRDRPRAVILALHGFNDYSHAFEGPATAWAKAGIATFAYDQRGFGAAPGRGLWPGRAVLASDAVTACNILRRLYPDVPLYLLGESMGGAVAVIVMTGQSGTPIPDVDGVILSAPAVWGRSAMDLVPRVALFVGVRLFPGLTLTGQSLHIMASDNIPMLRALGRDPLVIKETRVDTVWGLVNLMDAALAAAPRMHVRLLVMYGAHDEIIPKRSMQQFVRHLPHDPRQRPSFAYYRRGYHMLLRDLEAPVVRADVAEWILMPGLPLFSGADRDAFEADLGAAKQAALAGQ